MTSRRSLSRHLPANLIQHMRYESLIIQELLICLPYQIRTPNNWACLIGVLSRDRCDSEHVVLPEAPSSGSIMRSITGCFSKFLRKPEYTIGNRGDKRKSKQTKKTLCVALCIPEGTNLRDKQKRNKQKNDGVMKSTISIPSCLLFCPCISRMRRSGKFVCRRCEISTWK